MPFDRKRIMRILYYGPTDGNSGFRLRGLQLLGHEVEYLFKLDSLIAALQETINSGVIKIIVLYAGKG